MKTYTKEQIENAYEKIIELLSIVGELEATFEGRLFTLDGHLVGSIGEVMAVYYYGIALYPPSAPTHDGIAPDGREVQIKITQQDRIVINEEPSYLIVLHLNRKTGEISEIYNGPGKEVWETAYIYEKHNTRYAMRNRLLALDANVKTDDRIPMVNPINKYNKIVKQKVNTEIQKENKRRKSSGKSLETGYINSNNQKNTGCTGKEGNHKGQLFYGMKCMECGYEYEANGCDVWLRKCPNCQVK